MRKLKLLVARAVSAVSAMNKRAKIAAGGSAAVIIVVVAVVVAVTDGRGTSVSSADKAAFATAAQAEQHAPAPVSYNEGLEAVEQCEAKERDTEEPPAQKEQCNAAADTKFCSAAAPEYQSPAEKSKDEPQNREAQESACKRVETRTADEDACKKSLPAARGARAKQEEMCETSLNEHGTNPRSKAEQLGLVNERRAAEEEEEAAKRLAPVESEAERFREQDENKAQGCAASGCQPYGGEG